jgi:phosphoenolpyruvate-protein kinase (PTS system EI component)
MTSRSYPGIGASGGVAAGSAHLLNERVSSNGGRRDMGIDEALDAVARELGAAADRLRDSGHGEEAEILSVGGLIALDPVLREQARAEAAQGRDPAEAVVAAAEGHAAAMEALREPVLRERAADIRQVGRRAAAIIRGETAALPEGGGPFVLMAFELGPADVIGLEGGEVVAGVAIRGGPNSHAAIVARTLGLPLVLGVDAGVLEVAEGTAVIVDGDAGTVTIHPQGDQLASARGAMDAADRRRSALAGQRDLPSVTSDGRHVSLLCNVATAAETAMGLEAGADGVGLLRTELTFLDAPRWPTEEDHRRVLEPVLDLLEARTAVVRVLDFGGDKVPPFLAEALPERDLGPHARGLPALLSDPDALGAQLRAALRAGRKSRLGILVPMVTSIREAGLAREILEQAAADTGAEVPGLGAMIEVPAAAFLADRLAEEMDFLSIGTNDLTEHVLGINRRDPGARPALAAHPSVLTLINRVARVGREAGKAVRVCGEAASDPLVLPLLVGMGIESVSVSPAKVDEVRARVRQLSFDTCAEVAKAAMASAAIEEVWDLVRERCWTDLP